MNKYKIEAFSVVSALGRGKAETWANLRRGVAPGMRKLTGLTAGDTTYFGFLPGWGSERPSEFKTGECRVGAIVEAVYAELADAVERVKAQVGAERIGIVLGSSNTTMEEFTDNPDHLDMNYPAAKLKDISGVLGPVLTVSTACSSSAKAFASARRLLEGGVVDYVLVGGADAYTRTVVEGFHALEALSSEVCRPCSRFRSGITLGEGAALFLMGRAVTTEGLCLIGIGESSDAHHLTAPDPEGRGAEASMQAALEEAALKPDALNFVNLHGTGTIYNDAMELKALRRLFGVAPEATLPVCAFSTKPLTGHCLGAAGAIEAAIVSLALENGWDKMNSRVALSNSFAFGGSNASVVFRFLF